MLVLYLYSYYVVVLIYSSIFNRQHKIIEKTMNLYLLKSVKGVYVCKSYIHSLTVHTEPMLLLVILFILILVYQSQIVFFSVFLSCFQSSPCAFFFLFFLSEHSLVHIHRLTIHVLATLDIYILYLLIY